MTVLPGEGTHPILYGSFAIQSGLRSRPGYLARPDLSGRYPGLLFAHDGKAITPAGKALCRAFARHGYAVVAPQLPPEPAQAVAALQDGLGFLASEDTPWAGGRMGLVAVGSGGVPALRWAARRPGIEALVLCYAELSPSLGEVGVPVLGLYGRRDEVVTEAAVTEAARSSPGAEWVVYAGVGHDFLDDASTSYHEAAARDAVQRALGYLGGRLSAGAAA